MLVAELRQRMLERVELAAEAGDEGTAAVVLTHTRAALIALAQYPADSEIALRDLKVGTGTAALILGLHPEYVRHLIRRGRLESTKENGEHRILLAEIADFAATGLRSVSSVDEALAKSTNLFTMAQSAIIVWQRPHEEADPAA